MKIAWAIGLSAIAVAVKLLFDLSTGWQSGFLPGTIIATLATLWFGRTGGLYTLLFVTAGFVLLALSPYREFADSLLNPATLTRFTLTVLVIIFALDRAQAARSHAEVTQQSLKRNNDSLKLLSRSASNFLSETDPVRLVNRVFDEVRDWLGVDAFFNFQIDPSRGDDKPRELRLIAAGGVDESVKEAFARVSFTKTPCGICAATGNLLHLTHIQSSTDPINNGLKSLGVRAYAGFPLKAAGELRGTISFCSKSKDEFSPEDLDVLQTIALQVAGAQNRIRTERAMRDTDESLRLGSLLAGLAVARVDYELGWVHLDSTSAKLYGFPAEDQVVSRSEWRDRFHPEDRKLFDQHLEQTMASGADGWVALEHRVIWPDGTVRWLNVRKQIYFESREDGQRRPTYAILAARDITDEREAADALRDREQHVRRVLNSLFTFVGVLSTDGTVLGANDAPLKAAGINATDVIGRKFWDTYWWSGSKELQDQIKDCVSRAAKGEVIRFDCETLVANGKTIITDFMIAPMRDDDGNITHLIPSGVDISDRIAAQQQLAERERQYRSITEAVPVFVWTAADDGKLDYISSRFSDYTGRPINQMLGDGWVSTVHPDDRPAVAKLWQHSLRSNEPYFAEFRIRRHDGLYRWQQARAVPMNDEKGATGKWYGAVLDIDDLKRAESQLRSMYETSLMGILQFSADGTIIAANDAFLKMLGWTREQFDAEPMNSGNISPPSEERVTREAVQQFKDTGHIVPFEKEYVRRDGSVFPALVSASTLDPESNQRGVAFIVDISRMKSAELELRQLTETLERRVAERTAELDERSKQLRGLALDLADTESRERKRLAQILHDHFQQLISAAKLKVGIARRRTTDDSQAESFRQIESLLDEAITESRSLATELSPPVLHDAGLQAAFEWLARKVRRDHGLTVEVLVEPGSEPDNERVRLVLFDCVRELLFNVVKHAGVKNAEIVMRMRLEGLLSIIVRDSGKGFDPNSNLTGHAPDGSFGLFSIRERLTMLGGLLDIRSEPGEGTELEISVPVVTKSETYKTTQSKEAELMVPPTEAIRSVQVMVADDHKMFREGLISLISQEPYVNIVAEAGDGQEAVDLARKTNPDILIVDVSMPKLNGVEVTAILKRERPNIRVIGLSMHERDDMAKAMRDAGAVAYCTKGGPTEVLLNVLKSVAAETGQTA